MKSKLIILIFWALTFLLLGKGFLACSDSKVKPGRDYVEVGYYYSKSMRAWSIYLPNADEDTARAVALKYLDYNKNRSNRFGFESSEKHSCSIQFFDNLEFTPDFKGHTRLTKLQERHQVAVFWYDHETESQVFEWIGKEEDKIKRDTLLHPGLVL